MKKIILTAVLLGSAAMAAPSFAQGVYIGPNGVGIDTGRHDYYDRDRYDDRYDRGDRYYEGRSAYPDRPRYYYRDRD